MCDMQEYQIPTKIVLDKLRRWISLVSECLL